MEILTGQTFTQNKKVRKLEFFESSQIYIPTTTN